MCGITLWVLAETVEVANINPPSSGDFWNPSNYSWLGGDKFLVLVFAGFFMFFVYRALNKWDKHLTRSERLQSTQLNLCSHVHSRGGVGNNTSLLDAGHAAANIAQIMADGIGKEVGEAVKPEVQKFHAALNTRPRLRTPDIDKILGAENEDND